MKSKKWSAYIMVGNIKIYLRKSMTTMEAINWLNNHCKNENSNHYMCGAQVFCERK